MTMDRPLHINTTINIECLTSDVVSIYDQVTNSASYFLGCASSTKRDALQNSLFGLLWNIREHVRLNKARANGIDRHTIACQLQGCCLCKTDNACFGR